MALKWSISHPSTNLVRQLQLIISVFKRRKRDDESNFLDTGQSLTWLRVSPHWSYLQLITVYQLTVCCCDSGDTAAPQATPVQSFKTRLEGLIPITADSRLLLSYWCSSEQQSKEQSRCPAQKRKALSKRGNWAVSLARQIAFEGSESLRCLSLLWPHTGMSSLAESYQSRHQVSHNHQDVAVLSLARGFCLT